MAFSVTAEPERFDEAAEWFANRIPITEELAATLDDYAAQRAFKISGVAQLDIVQQVHDSLLLAIERGTPFEEWQSEISDTLTNAWGKRDSYKLETIFRNATQQSYNAGRWRQMREPDVLRFRPYGLFDAVLDSRTTKEICRPIDGTILPLDDPWWDTRSPQLHHRCRSGIRNIRESEAKRRGITTTPPNEQASEGFGSPPTVADWEPSERDYNVTLWAEYQRKRQQIEDSAVRHRVPVPDED